jgi:hypothetical protein
LIADGRKLGRAIALVGQLGAAIADADLKSQPLPFQKSSPWPIVLRRSQRNNFLAFLAIMAQTGAVIEKTETR